MKIVYIVIFTEPYEFSEIVEVFATNDKAKAFIEEKKNTPEFTNEGFTPDDYVNWEQLSIEEWEVK